MSLRIQPKIMPIYYTLKATTITNKIKKGKTTVGETVAGLVPLRKTENTLVASPSSTI